MNADKGKLLQFVDDMLLYGNMQLTGVWVDKLMGFRAAGLDFDPVFKALQSLMANPTADARERFPIFAERNRFGFLPDGRIGAFKAVRDDFRDHHSGTFDNSPGKVLEMPREHVDADPNRTCSNGLHLGALEYVKTYLSHTSKIVFCAFWPKDVVAVPTDYDGTKMRVCRYEVLEEVDPAFVEEFLGERTLVIEDPKVTRFKNGYLKGWDLFDDDAYAASLKEMIDTRASLEKGDADYLAGFDQGWRDASADNAFDDAPPEAERHDFSDLLEDEDEDDRDATDEEDGFDDYA
jgi:hypothetical protein